MFVEMLRQRGMPGALRVAEMKLHEKARVMWRDEGLEFGRLEVEDDGKLHGISYNTKVAKGKAPIVCLHGYGTGSGIWCTSLPVLSVRLPERAIHALDTLGCGLSSREEEWSKTASGVEAEEMVVDALDVWREKKGYDEIVLVGHSIGAVFATAYAEKFPGRVSTLVLASPAGVAKGVAPPKEEKSDEKPSSFNAYFRQQVKRWVLTAWRRGLFDPLSTVQCFLSLGRRAIHSYVARRFSEKNAWTRRLKPELEDYLFENALGGPVSLGGALLTLLLVPLKPSAGLRPLEDRLIQPHFLPGKQLAFIYGQRDWMPHAPADHVRSLRETNLGRTTPVLFVDDGASHNLMVDNPIGFADAIISLLDGTYDDLR